jgi:homoserine dehydrogenase
LLGVGTVGAAVARRLLAGGEPLARRVGRPLLLRHVLVRDPARRRSFQIPSSILRTDVGVILNDDETSIVVELIGGVDDARRLTFDAVRAGKDVVTANKALLAVHGREIFAAARSAGRCVTFEGAVAGGIPLIEAIRRGLAANRIDAVYGILNGTCNYILTRMIDNGASYAHALGEAQRLGYAEADPTTDVSGLDAAHKLAILASLAMGRCCDLDRIAVKGISDIDLIDLTAAAELGLVCKLLAIARRHGGDISLAVEPRFIPRSHPLAAVSGPFNAVSVYGDLIGHCLFYGPGAGGDATASAVLADILDVASGNAAKTFAAEGVLWDQTPAATYAPAGEDASPHYIRVGLVDRPGGIAQIATILGNAGISIASIIQHESPYQQASDPVPVVVTTHPARQRDVRAAVTRFGELKEVLGAPVCIPVLEKLGPGGGK